MVMVAVGVYARLLKHAGELGGPAQPCWLRARLGLGCGVPGVLAVLVTAGRDRSGHGVPGSGPCHPPHHGGRPHLPHHLLRLRRLLAGEHLPAAAGECCQALLGTLVASRCPSHGHLTVTFLVLQFSVCMTIIFLLQLAAGVLGFVFSDEVLGGAVGVLGDPILSCWVTAMLVSPVCPPGTREGQRDHQRGHRALPG